MLNQPSNQTKSFLALTALAFVGAGLSYLLSRNIYPSEVQAPVTTQNSVKKENSETKSAEAATEPLVNTENWIEYSNEELNLSFKYAPTWKVMPPKKAGDFYIVEIDPGPKYYNLKIFVSPTGYYVLDGLNANLSEIGGKQALNVSNMLYAVQSEGFHYTFDLDRSVILQPEFSTLVHTVAFR
jgi:hypothetical protein